MLRQRGISPSMHHRLDLTMQSARRQAGERFQPFRQIRLKPVCRAIALTPPPCRFTSKIITISLNPTAREPFHWPQQGNYARPMIRGACPPDHRRQRKTAELSSSRFGEITANADRGGDQGAGDAGGTAAGPIYSEKTSTVSAVPLPPSVSDPDL
jgi:hypothetical protein